MVKISQNAVFNPRRYAVCRHQIKLNFYITSINGATDQIPTDKPNGDEF